MTEVFVEQPLVLPSLPNILKLKLSSLQWGKQGFEKTSKVVQVDSKTHESELQACSKILTYSRAFNSLEPFTFKVR